MILCEHMGRACATLLILLFSLGACTKRSEECFTTQDCFDQGVTLGECVNGSCQRTCETDENCAYSDASCPPDDAACLNAIEDLKSASFICEAFVCVAGCPDVACSDGATCRDGRCEYFSESFEASQSGDFVNLQSLGWNNIDRDLRNTKLIVAWSGGKGCDAVGDIDRCAGPAGEGEYFAVLERSQATPRAPRDYGMTCRACACCLACQDPLARTSTTSVCPGVIYPEVSVCTESILPECQTICDTCSQCPQEPTVADSAGLNACEARVAPQTCDACIAYDQCLASKEAENRPCPGDAATYPECSDGDPASRTAVDCQRCLLKECSALEDNCLACKKAASLKTSNPDEPELWRDLQATCDALEANACYEVPKKVIRTDLTFDEQALESPEIDLGAANTKSLILEFRFVAFDVGDSFVRVIQGTPETEWITEEQRVAVQFCGGNCQIAENWKDATVSSPSRPASFPAVAQKNNNLLFGEQNQSDWTINTMVVSLPSEMVTQTFRFRFVPILGQDVRVAIDDISIREVTQ
ncbi:MAG: hypothetical protein VYC39_02465 [Myxococcota bacterium]|nr:hypothetical protein [Myxococcota bacterium]